MRIVAHGSEGVSLTKGIHFRLTDAHGKVSAAAMHVLEAPSGVEESPKSCSVA